MVQPTRETTPQKRVNNRLGLLRLGGAGRRIVVLFDCRAFSEFSHEDNLVQEISARAGEIVKGVIRLRKEDDGYHGDIAEGREPGFERILRRLALAIAEEDRVEVVWWGRRSQPSRVWSPFPGLRRRGYQAVSKFRKATGLSNERAHQHVELLWRAFQLDVKPSPPEDVETALD